MATAGHVSHPLEDRLKRLQHEYKVLWVYYQTAQSLLRTLLKLRQIEDVGLESVYRALSELMQADLNQIPDAEHRLAQIEDGLKRARYVLTQFDANVQPAVIRRYIERLETFDDRFLVYLVQFILGKYPLAQDDWDKVDLLLTKLFIVRDAQSQQFVLRPEDQILQLRDWITMYYDMPFLPADRVRWMVERADGLAHEIEQVTSYTDLLEWKLLARLRDYKKNVQFAMLHPQVVIPFFRLNLTTKRKFMQLYQHEIDRIQSSIHTLERLQPTGEIPAPHTPEPVSTPSQPDETPRMEVTHTAILESEEFVQILATLEHRMESLMDMLRQLLQRTESTGVIRLSDTELDMLRMQLAEADHIEVPEWLQPDFERLMTAFQKVNWDRTLSEIAFSEPLRAFSLEPTEVEAYQMGFLYDRVTPDERAVYRLILLSAILRYRMAQTARKLVHLQQSTPDQWVQQVDADAIQQIRDMLETAELYERHLLRCQELFAGQFNMWRRCSRALRKLQRARVGLSLLLDQIEEQWQLQKGPLPERLAPTTYTTVFVRPQFTTLFTWLGWLVAVAMFVLVAILLLR